MTIAGDPYDYPFDGDLQPTNTALMVIDMQFDFCGEGGYVDKMGYDISLTRAAIEPIRKALAAARSWGCHILHTREGHRRDLSDLPAYKQWRSRRIGAGIGDRGPNGR
ncbi:MAG: cysteine hydrolase family protein, partial [Candidatus Binataceae bacterium]